MGVNKVQLASGETLVDMSDATATAATVLAGYTAYGADGNLIHGTAQTTGGTNRMEVSVTLPASGWVDDHQTVSVPGVTTDSMVICGGDSASEPEYSTCEVYCAEQANGSLVFSYAYPPMEDVVANVLILTGFGNDTTAKLGTAKLGVMKLGVD